MFYALLYGGPFSAFLPILWTQHKAIMERNRSLLANECIDNVKKA